MEQSEPEFRPRTNPAALQNSEDWQSGGALISYSVQTPSVGGRQSGRGTEDLEPPQPHHMTQGRGETL